MNIRLSLAVALMGPALLFAPPVFAQAAPAAQPMEAATPAQRLIELGQRDNQVMSHLVELTSQFGPRLTGSSNLNRAGEWARDRFASYGLDARLEKWGEFPVGFQRGESSGKLLGEEPRELTFVTMAWTPGTDGPKAGRVMLEPTSKEGLKPEDYRGAWILRRARAERPKVKLRRELDELLLCAGILGELRDGGNNPIVDGRYKISMDDLPKLVSVRLLRSDYSELMRRVTEGDGATVEFDIENHFIEGPIEQYNVVADIKGSEFPDEYVIVGGHLDSWDPAVGAQDNGTGVSTTLEAARLIMKAGIKPRRTIRFMLWGGEEQGLLGSSAYVRAHPEVCEKTSAVLVHDGGGNYLSGLAGPAALVDDLRKVSEPLVGLAPEMPFKVTENRGLSPRGASDHSSFVAAGVPGFFWNQSGDLDYNYIHHTLHDHVSEVNEDYQEHSAIVVAVVAVGLADLDHMLDRTDLVRKRPAGNRRTMGVMLDENLITDVLEGTQAEKLGMQPDDLIVAVDGAAVGSREEVVSELRKGDPKKTVTVQRGDQRLDFVFVWEAPKKAPAREPK